MPARIHSYNAVFLFGIAIAMVLTTGLVVGLLDGGHPHVNNKRQTPAPVMARRLLSVADDPRNAFDHEMRKRGYSHLSVRSNAQFTGVARDMFPFASKPMVLDVYASIEGQAHWLVISSADYNTKSDWKSLIVTKSNNSYVVSAQHKTLHKDIVESIHTSLQ